MFINNECLFNCDKSMNEITKRQREFQRFLYEWYAFICTKGKKDILYVKVALLKYADEYSELIDDNFFYFIFLKELKE